MSGGGSRSMRPGRHHHGLASAAQAVPAAASACKCIQLKLNHVQRTLEHVCRDEAAAQLESSVQGKVQAIMDVGKPQVPDAA